MNRNTAATFTHSTETQNTGTQNTRTQNNGTHSNASRLTNLGIGLMIILSVAIGLYAIAFQTGILGSPEIQAKFAEWPVFSSMHIIGGAVVIITGGFQFWPKLRTDHINFHRWLGRIYLLFVLVGGVGGLVIAPRSDGGLVAHFGFGMLAVVWLFSGWQAYISIRRGDIASHRAWMMRNYSMTFGAVMLRVYLGLFAAAGVDFVDAYPTVSWIAWVPNLILVEWYLALKAAKRITT